MVMNAKRRFDRYNKAMRRLREDRAQHGNPQWGDPLGRGRFTCSCFFAAPGKDAEAGRTFSRFADYPASCSKVCCSNSRKHYGETLQEKKAATPKDWADDL